MKKNMINTTFTIIVIDQRVCQKVYHSLKKTLVYNHEYNCEIVNREMEIEIKAYCEESDDISETLSYIIDFIKLDEMTYSMLCKNTDQSVMKFDIYVDNNKFPCMGIEQEYVSFLYDIKACVEYDFHLIKRYEVETDNNFLKPIEDDGRFVDDKTKIMVEFSVYSSEDMFDVKAFNRNMKVENARYWRKGDVWSETHKVTRLSKNNIWIYKTQYVETLSMKRILEEVLDDFKNKEEILIEASKISSVTIAFEVVFGIEKNVAPNINISYDIIKYIHKIGASFWFDPYWYS